MLLWKTLRAGRSRADTLHQRLYLVYMFGQLLGATIYPLDVV